MSKITHIKFENLKGLSANLSLSGKDVFFGPTGSGKTTRLNAIEIAILGYSPSSGIGKRHIDTAKLIGGNGTEDTMTISILTDTGFSIERQFTKFPVSHSVTVSPNFGEDTVSKCEARISMELGDFPVMWNISEFMQLSDDKKRNFIFGLYSNGKWAKKNIMQYIDVIHSEDEDVANSDFFISLKNDIKTKIEASNEPIQEVLNKLINFLKHQLVSRKQEISEKQQAVRELIKSKNAMGIQTVSTEDIGTLETTIKEIEKQYIDVKIAIVRGKENMKKFKETQQKIATLKDIIKNFGIDEDNFNVEYLKQEIKEIRKKLDDLNIIIRNCNYFLNMRNLLVDNKCPIFPEVQCNHDFKDILTLQTIDRKDFSIEEYNCLNDQKREYEEKLSYLSTQLEKFKNLQIYKEKLAFYENEIKIDIPDISMLELQAKGLLQTFLDKQAELEKKREYNKMIIQINDLNLNIENLKEEIKCIKVLLNALGPRGLLGNMVKDMVESIFDKANLVLSQIDSNMKISVKLYDEQEREIFEIGWQRGSEWIPFECLSSGQKVLFSIALAIALILSKNPPCKVLGIELGECDTATSQALLVSLDKIAHLIDNIIVCSWHKFSVPEGWRVWNL